MTAGYRKEHINISTASIADINRAFAMGVTAEELVFAYLNRIHAYDKSGPKINAVITLNPKALETATRLDNERKSRQVRGPLHGVPIVLKDNCDTYDLPTTAGSQLLEGSIAPNDAFVVKNLRDAGAVIVAKVNMSEWGGVSGTVSCSATDPEFRKKAFIVDGFSSAGGRTLNPHDLRCGPSNSSGGTGASIAAAFAQFGLGTDTCGSVRGPASWCGIVGLRPTLGLCSRDGLVPLALSFDTCGPMARSVYDVAVALGAMTGIDPADCSTNASIGKFDTDYTKFLNVDAIKGARIGIARVFMGEDPETDRVMENAISILAKRGAVIIDPLLYPQVLLDLRASLPATIISAEFKAHIGGYLKTTTPKYPKSFIDLVERTNDRKSGFRSPGLAISLRYQQDNALDLDDPIYLAEHRDGLALVRSSVQAIFTKYKVDAIVYPTLPMPAKPMASIDEMPVSGPNRAAVSIAAMAGLPELIVPAGTSKDGLPVSISFFGRAFSEGKLFGYGCDFEQSTKARVLPKNTPALTSDMIFW